MITKNSIIPIQILTSGNNNLFEALVRANTSKIIKVPVSVHDGDIFVSECNINKCHIPAIVTRAQSGYAYLQITNPTNNDIIVSLVSPLKAHSVHNNFDLYNFETLSLKNENIVFN